MDGSYHKIISFMENPYYKMTYFTAMIQGYGYWQSFKL